MSRYIISLTSIPPRFPELHDQLACLVNQSVPAEKVILYLSRSYQRFPDWDGTLPEVPEGVEIRLVDEDWGPATKVLPAVRDFHGQDLDILFCDDDQFYPPHLAAEFLKARKRHPDAPIAASPSKDWSLTPVTDPNNKRPKPRVRRLWRATNLALRLQRRWRRSVERRTGKVLSSPPHRRVLRAGFADGFEGYMGVLVRPEFFPDEVFDIPDFAWPVDDVWLSGHLVRMGRYPWVIGGLFQPRMMAEMTVDHASDTALFRSQFEGKRRSESNLTTVRYFQETYGVWL